MSVLNRTCSLQEKLLSPPPQELEHYYCVFVSIGFANLPEITKDFDENKENKTPEGAQGEVDWLQQYDMEREREEQELQQALAQSLQEQVRAMVSSQVLQTNQALPHP